MFHIYLSKRKNKQIFFLKTNLEIPIFLVRKYSNDFYPRLERCLHLCLKVLASPPLKKKKRLKEDFLLIHSGRVSKGHGRGTASQKLVLNITLLPAINNPP